MAAQTDIEAVYRRHIGTVYRLCYSFLGSAAEAEDAAQAVFLSLVEHPARSTTPNMRRRG